VAPMTDETTLQPAPDLITAEGLLRRSWARSAPGLARPLARAQLGAAVGINPPFAGEAALHCGWKVPVEAAPTGKRVLVAGAGPSGPGRLPPRPRGIRAAGSR
jgi:hypothetical protein